MEYHLGSPAGEAPAKCLNELAELLDAGLFADVVPGKADTVKRYIARCADSLADRYEDLPMLVDFQRTNDGDPTPFAAFVQFEYVDTVSVERFFKRLVKADAKLAKTLLDALSDAGSWWFPIFTPAAAYETAYNDRFAFTEEWWEELRDETKETLELDREPTNREVRKYIRIMNVPTPSRYAKRLDARLCRAKGLTYEECASRISALRSRELRSKTALLYNVIDELLQLRERIVKLHTRDDQHIEDHQDGYGYEKMAGLIVDAAAGPDGAGYVSEIYAEYEQRVWNSNGWGANYYFALEPTPQSVSRLHAVLNVYALAYQQLFRLKYDLGDKDE